MVRNISRVEEDRLMKNVYEAKDFRKRIKRRLKQGRNDEVAEARVGRNRKPNADSTPIQRKLRQEGHGLSK